MENIYIYAFSAIQIDLLLDKYFTYNDINTRIQYNLCVVQRHILWFNEICALNEKKKNEKFDAKQFHQIAY